MASLALVLAAALAVVAAAISWLWHYAVVCLVWRPYAVSRKFREQGIHGPLYRFMRGCIEEMRRLKEEGDGVVLDVHDHNHLPRIAPHYLKWRAQYGEPFVYWFGAKPHICIFDYELARQVLSSKSGHFVKNDAHQVMVSLLGKGLVLVDGVDWVRHRRVINPAFAKDRIKTMTKTMVASAQRMSMKWEEWTSKEKNNETQLEVGKWFQELTADIISRTAFGSSYKLGIEAFHAQKELQTIFIASVLSTQFPGSSYFPTKRNRRKWMLDKKAKRTLMQIVQSRLASMRQGGGYGDDLLGVMLEACMSSEQQSVVGKRQQQRLSLSLSMDEIIHECKTFFFAGYETTSLLLTWTVFLLSVYPEWQERLRSEVMRECGEEDPTADTLSKMKEMTMVLLEALRLYSPAQFIQRKTIADTMLGGIKVPKDTAIIIPIQIMQRDKKIWGDDVDEFRPLRFRNGVSKAGEVPHAMLAFSIGPRACIGQNFAMVEAKSVMAVLLRRFAFTLSSEYVHAPVDMITLQPKFGLPVHLRRLDAST